MATYSFLNVSAVITGPGGNFDMAEGAGSAEEAITAEPLDDKNTMTLGAGGEGMHSLHAASAGTITARFLKTSSRNAMLMSMYNTQVISSSLHGTNIIRVSQTSIGEVIAGVQCAFKKRPSMAYAKDGGTVEWQWDVINLQMLLGTY